MNDDKPILDDIPAIIERLKEALKAASDRELALMLGLGASAVAMWRTRNTITWDAVLRTCIERRVDLNWLFVRGGKTAPLDREGYLNRIASLEGEVRSLRYALELAMGKPGSVIAAQATSATTRMIEPNPTEE